jgi:hypothetical protein
MSDLPSLAGVQKAARQAGEADMKRSHRLEPKAGQGSPSPGAAGLKHYALMFGTVEPRCTGCGIFIPGGNPANPNLLCNECKAWTAHRIHIRQAREALIKRRAT